VAVPTENSFFTTNILSNFLANYPHDRGELNSMTTPTVEQTIEADIWVACVDGVRDWTEPERQWILTHDIETNLLDWWASDASEGCWTDANHQFMTQIAKDYPWMADAPNARTNPHDPETQRQFAAFVRGEPVSDEFLTELANRTGHLLTELQARGWNPDQAGEELVGLFTQADRIFQQPHYRDNTSADGLDNSSAGSLPTDQTDR
jgi:hypothetical protein